MAFRPKTIRRSPMELRKHMRAYNTLAQGLRIYRKLIEAELVMAKQRKQSVRRLKTEAEEAEELFKD